MEIDSTKYLEEKSYFWVKPYARNDRDNSWVMCKDNNKN